MSFPFSLPGSLAAWTILQVCLPGFTPLDLHSQKTCAARFEAATQGQQSRPFTFCLDAALLRERIQSTDSLHSCGVWKGYWKSDSQFIAKEWLPQARPPGKTPFSFLLDPLDRLRIRIADTLQSHDPTGVLLKLTVNQSSADSAGDLLRRLGFVHLLTATGIHLYALASLWNAFGRIALLRIGVSLPTARAASMLLASLSWIFAWGLAGARPGMLRPAIIVILRTLAGCLGFRWSRWAPLCIALGMDGLIALFHSDWAPGRWIYALAVGGGMIAISSSSGSAAKTHAALAIGSWAPVAVWEIAADHLFSWATPLLSLITLPLYSLFLFPLTLLASAFSSHGLLIRICQVSHAFLQACVRLVGHVPALWVISPLSLLAGILGGSAVFFLLKIPQIQRLRWLLLFTLMATVVLGRSFLRHFTFPVPTPPMPRAARLEQLNVGQGDALLLQLRQNQCGLIDAGGFYGKRESDWLSLFARRSCFQLRFVALTHLDEDHRGGLEKLAGLIPIQQVFASERQWQSPAGLLLKQWLKRQKIETCSLDRSEHFCPFSFPFLIFRDPKQRSRNRVMNAYAIPLEKGGFYLSAGDLASALEPTLMKWVSGLPFFFESPRILKVSHHGAKSSTSLPLLRAFRPTEAWISVGRNNRFGHPSRATLARLAQESVLYRRTDLEDRIFYPSF